MQCNAEHQFLAISGNMSVSLKRALDTAGAEALSPAKVPALPIFIGRDASYPPALNALIQPLFCTLCQATFNTMISSNNHYQSRKHDQRLTNWLKQNYLYQNLPVPDIKRFYSASLAPYFKGHAAFYCEYCDLELPSLEMAQQHYASRRHRNILAKYNNGAEIGCSSQQTVVAESLEAQQITKKVVVPAIPTKAVHCAVCNIYVPSASEMQMHEQGAKHQRQLKFRSRDAQYTEAISSKTQDSIYDSLFESNKQRQTDFSMYRTPTGYYYCQTCSLRLEGEHQLKQHLEGLRHVKNTQKQKLIK